MKTGDESPGAAEPTNVRQQASEWIAKRDAGFLAQEQDEFFEWLAADPKHAEVYAELQSVYRQMDIMVEWRPLHALEPNPDLLASPRPRSRKSWVFTVLGGIAAMVAVGLFSWSEWDGVRSPRPTLLAAGEAARSYERHVLEDGSIVELNRGGQVSLRFEPRRRLLDLLSGEAYFIVAKDPSRPFVVRVGGVAVTAVGTEFNVALASDKLEVFVTEGRIRVDPSSRRRHPADAEPQEAAQTVDAGQGVVVSFDPLSSPCVVEDYSPRLLEQKLAWKTGLVDFTGVPLSEVILEFNRRNLTQLVIGDDDLRDLPITGTLRPTNLDGFLELLTVTQGIHVERFGTSKIVLRKQP